MSGLKVLLVSLAREALSFMSGKSNHEVLGTPCGKKTIIHPMVGEMIKYLLI